MMMVCGYVREESEKKGRLFNEGDMSSGDILILLN
jgi:hypothetical protein